LQIKIDIIAFVYNTNTYSVSVLYMERMSEHFHLWLARKTVQSAKNRHSSGASCTIWGKLSQWNSLL